MAIEDGDEFVNGYSVNLKDGVRINGFGVLASVSKGYLTERYGLPVLVIESKLWVALVNRLYPK
jgi:hypothetical protein